MNENHENRKHESLKITDRSENTNGGNDSSPSKTAAVPSPLFSNGMFYEIEYDSGIIPGVGKFKLSAPPAQRQQPPEAPKPQKIEAPPREEKRELFMRMRDIARAHRSAYDFLSRFYDRRERHDNAVIFYKQGVFMKDFTDDYTGHTAFSQYFPYYQMMGYEQLRTYFTWRTQVRQGNITDTSLSYAFLYIYELLNNIGADNPQDALNSLMFFWKGFSAYNKTIDKYVINWLKDYHIYYALPQPFKEFVAENGLTACYPEIAEAEKTAEFDLFCAISKYDISKSAFFTGGNEKLFTDCFYFVIEKIRREFEAAGINFNDAFFRPTRKVFAWQPFGGALFFNHLKQPDRRVILSENEIYICKNNEWTFSTVITTEKGRQFIGYVLKQTESVLRALTKYKYKLNAAVSMVHAETLRKLIKAGLYIDKTVSAAVTEFYRAATKTVVTVDHTALERIRREALITQEALTVEEQPEPQRKAAPPIPPPQDAGFFAEGNETEPFAGGGVWAKLRDALSKNEISALSALLSGGGFNAFALKCGVMPEVLADGINEKAADCIGDNLLDGDFVLYDDYKEQIKELLANE